MFPLKNLARKGLTKFGQQSSPFIFLRLFITLDSSEVYVSFSFNTQMDSVVSHHLSFATLRINKASDKWLTFIMPVPTNTSTGL